LGIFLNSIKPQETEIPIWKMNYQMHLKFWLPSHFDIPARLGGLASAQAIEVLLKCRAFVVKRSAADQGVKGQITWAKVGGVEKAWAMAVERAGFQ
jgi:hypothetical protein